MLDCINAAFYASESRIDFVEAPHHAVFEVAHPMFEPIDAFTERVETGRHRLVQACESAEDLFIRHHAMIIRVCYDAVSEIRPRPAVSPVWG